MPWLPASSGVVPLPSGVFVRGRSLRVDLGPAELTLVLGHGACPPWPHRMVRWPDFGVPLDREDALSALAEAYARAREGQRVEVACHGGIGRTGTALAALVVLDGLGRQEAVSWVRTRYHARGVETPWQRHWLRHVHPGQEWAGPAASTTGKPRS